ncbi:MAG: VOC family protein [Synergistaceae bacterium]|jgi:methylmalonyl-CoA/ethylmalonyl-CoA epimerase|nr:VOC family protein [Synergistaceae bacterium]
MNFEHVGWAVNSIEGAESALNALEFERCGNITEDASRRVRILLMQNRNGTIVELVAPLGEGKNPVSNFLAKNGPSPYHCCFSANKYDAEQTISRLKQAGFKMLIPPSPAPALKDDEVVFLYSKDVGIVELVLRESSTW